MPGHSTTCSRPLRSRALTQKEGHFHPRGVGPAGQGQRQLAEGVRLFYLRQGGRDKVALTDPTPDYWLDYKDEVLTLNFMLPFKTPVKAKELKIEIYDPTIFVDFAFDKQDPAGLVGAPKCKLDVQLPREMTFAEGKKLSEIPADEKNPTMAWGAQFANKILVSCP